MTPEHQRLQAAHQSQTPWQKWGPYLSDRQWGTVREDYSATGAAWGYFSHQQSHSRAYRWGEDGLGGICDNQQQLCFALALWNGNDPVLKERLFGLTGEQGNHGEDVKEYYFYLDSTPTHSYLKFLYKYPQAAYPYADLVAENQRRGREQPEYELLDTGVFNENRYFDVFVEYAKATPEDILIHIEAINRGPEAATLHLLPTLWFRNTWAWGDEAEKPRLRSDRQSFAPTGDGVIEAFHPTLGNYWLHCEGISIDGETPPLYFTENETNYAALFGGENASPYVKDGIHNAVIHGQNAVNPDLVGTKVSPHYQLSLGPGERQTVRLRLTNQPAVDAPLGAAFEAIFQTRRQEADDFYAALTPPALSDDQRNIQRQAIAGLLWSKQVYTYSVEQWLKGDAAMPAPPPGRNRNRHWRHLDTADIISMPDKWEYPWFAAWDLAFHCIPLAMVDPEFAKHQLDLLTREWYMHPNGQLPAYEWAFGDVNPPVHAWATWRVYKIAQKMTGPSVDHRPFLERVFQKLLLNFTWWVNRKDRDGKNVFEGGFLGLDNIGVFDRSAPLPTGGSLEQSDGTSWMAMYCLNMLEMALELALENSVYEDMATKFFEHFIYIADAMNHIGDDQTRLWNEEDGFFYDVLHLPEGDDPSGSASDQRIQMKIRSMVGLIPLCAVITLEPDTLAQLPNFAERLEWFIQNRPHLKRNVACMETQGQGARRMLALCYATLGHIEPRDRLRRLLEKLLDEAEFLSDYGIRALSKYHADHPYRFHADGQEYRVDYEPAESRSGLFGGNSNWRGPIWFPVNYLLIESLQKFHHYLGDDYQVECPTGSGQWMNLWQVASELSRRLIAMFEQSSAPARPVNGGSALFDHDVHWRDYVLFYEYFHGDSGTGLGASHQTGWTGLVAKLIQQQGEYSGDRTTLPG
ncbi:MGH1-like glycoside hydrolase domain-containing protein [Nodosilinea sp. PGN35]|uniref:MGH1-like glycoside hydrolase domain-containing protein n=1 Tax=Nodosilinea sp. PGN35 TaxID=3020489 RepID=UPI0023B2D4C8|nr:glucosidase [Nodosilinea sp. TSF1-S3]MDF0369950.1 glucosidase [Nodosilinea sp. TSF1-S3]